MIVYRIREYYLNYKRWVSQTIYKHELQTDIVGYSTAERTGLTLFGLFISDLPVVLTHYKCRLYADYMQIYCPATPSELDNALALIERDAQAVSNWATTNGLGLNAKKTNVIILDSAHYVSSIDLISRVKLISIIRCYLILPI